MALRGQIAVVTGASRGLGQGIALQLGEAGATVYVTGRKPEHADGSKVGGLPSLDQTARDITDRGGRGIAAYVDHSDMEEVKQFFSRLEKETNGRLDILVNNAYSAIVPGVAEGIAEKKFFEADPGYWDTVTNVGLRNHYFCSCYSARLMAKQRKGLIVTISSAGGLAYLFSVAYGTCKQANDRMIADMAHELKSFNVACVSVWPGYVRTQLIDKKLENAEYANSAVGKAFKDGETTEFAGKAIVSLAADKEIMSVSGKILTTADLAEKYAFFDLNGEFVELEWMNVIKRTRPRSMFSLPSFARRMGWPSVGSILPSWIKIPGWVMAAYYSRF